MNLLYHETQLNESQKGFSMQANSNLIIQLNDNNVGDSLPSTVVYKTIEAQQLNELFDEYKDKKQDLEIISGLMSDYSQTVLKYFIEGNVDLRRTYTATTIVNVLFEKEKALKSLDADFWSQAINLSGVIDVMPQKRREEWFDNIKNHKTPEFTEQCVIPTLQGMMNSRLKFLAEKTDGVFRRLSSDHLTNSPWGFNKRMIISCVLCEWGYANTTASGYINDLRDIIGMLQNRGSIGHSNTYSLIDKIRHHPGKWFEVDGGALRIKVFKKGTAHIEIHPEIAFQLNDILSVLYPNAIAESHRTKKNKTSSAKIKPVEETISFDVISEIVNMRTQRFERILFFSETLNNEIKKKVIAVLERIGGVCSNNGSKIVFDYDCNEALDHLVYVGTLPEVKSHQYYPTPPKLAKIAVDLADIEDHHTCLEPSAGSGSLALQMGLNTECVEYSDLHCKILKSHGFLKVHNEDFIKWSETQNKRYDRIVLNPPFTKGQAKNHLQTAANMLAQNGKLVAILPASLKGKILTDGFVHDWSEDTFTDEFAGTGVSVSILKLTRM